MEKLLQKILQVLNPQELATFLKSVRNDLSPADFDKLIEYISGMQPTQPQGQPQGSQQGPKDGSGPGGQGPKDGSGEGQQQPQAKDIANLILELVKKGEKVDNIIKQLKAKKVPEELIQEALAIVKQTLEQQQQPQGQQQQQQYGGEQKQQYNNKPQGGGQQKRY